MRFSNLLANPILTAGAGLFAVVLIGAIYLGAAYGFGWPPFSREQNLPSNIQIVLDRSLAMEEPYGNGTKMEAAIRAINERVLTHQVASSGNIAFRQYGGTCAGDNTQLLVGFGHNNQQNVESALRDLNIGGETTFIDGIIQAIRDFSQAERPDVGHNEIIVIAGGDDTCQLQDSAALIRQEIERAGIQVKIQFIGLDVPLDQRSRFSEIALAISGELPVYANSPIELEEKLTQIIDRIPIPDLNDPVSFVAALTPTPASDSERNTPDTAPAVSDPQTSVDPEPEQEVEQEPQIEPEAKPEVRQEAEAEPEVEQEPEAEPEVKQEPEAEPEVLPNLLPEEKNPETTAPGGGGAPDNQNDDDDDDGSIFAPPINVPPLANSNQITTNEDTPVNITLTGGDLETNTADLVFTILQQPSNGTLTPSGSGTANRVYEPDPNFDQSESFTFTVTDRGDPDNCGTPGPGCLAPETSLPATVDITVIPEIDKPTNIVLSNTNVDEIVPLNVVIGTLSAVDPDTLDTATFTEILDPDNKFRVSGNELRLVGALDFETQPSHEVTIQVTDSAGETFIRDLTINVDDNDELEIGTLYGADASEGELLTLDTGTGIGSIVGFFGEVSSIPSLAADPNTGMLYAGGGSFSPDLYQINAATGEGNFIGSAGLDIDAINGMAFDSTGTLFASVDRIGEDGTGADHLVTIDPATGEATLVGPFGICIIDQVSSCTIEGIESIAFDPSGQLWGTHSERGAAGPPGLYAIDPSTGAATFVAPILDEQGIAPSGGIVGLEFVGEVLYGGTATATLQGDDGGRLVTIDPNTGLFAFVGSGSATGGRSLAGLALVPRFASPPTLTVEKIVINDNGGTATIGDFTLRIDGDAVISGVPTEVTPGPHRVSEDFTDGYTTVIGGDCDTLGNVVVIPGQNLVCTITNDDDPLSLNPTFGEVGTTVNVVGANFPPSATVDVTFGSTQVGPADTTTFGTFSLSVTVPPLPAGPVTVSATEPLSGVTSSATFLVVAPPATITAVDTSGAVGEFASIAIGTDGLPVISYFDASFTSLKVAHCGDLACSSATISAADTSGDVGVHTSIAIGTDGLPVISYYDGTNADLKVAHCADLACSSATISAVDTSGDVGRFTSIAIGTDGLPVISYLDESNIDLKVAHCGDLACRSATISAVDTSGDVGSYTSIAIGADGLLVISYLDESNIDLKVAHCDDLACSSATITAVDTPGSVGAYTSIAIGTDGLPVISYYDGFNFDLKVAHCGNLACSSATISAVDTSGAVGFFTSIAIGADGLPVVSYHDGSNNDLKVAHCGDLACNSATISAVDTSGIVGFDTSIAIGTDGHPVISYYDVANADLKVAHCWNVTCSVQ